MDRDALEAIGDLRRVVAWTDIILARLSDAVVVVHGKLRVIRYCNDSFARLAGADRIFLLGTPLDEHLPQLRAWPLVDGEPRALVAVLGGSERVLEVESARVSEEKGETVVVVRDVTEARRQAEELLRSNAELETFAYVASHDLQEPLRKVILFCQQLEAHAQGRLDPESQRLVASAVGASRRMERLIRDLLAYARVSKTDAPLEPTDLNEILAQTLDDLQAAIAESGAVVTAETLPTVAGRGSQLGEVFRNLVSNAIKFHSALPPRVRVRAERQDRFWLFSVEDNGIGFEPAYAERIFQMFQRLHPASRYPGAGMGLSISRKIVLGHGGRMWAESQPGQGSTFRFTLPAS